MKKNVRQVFNSFMVTCISLFTYGPVMTLLESSKSSRVKFEAMSPSSFIKPAFTSASGFKVHINPTSKARWKNRKHMETHEKNGISVELECKSCRVAGDISRSKVLEQIFKEANTNNLANNLEEFLM